MLNTVGKVSGEISAQEVTLKLSCIGDFSLKFANCKRIVMDQFPAKGYDDIYPIRHSIMIPTDKKVKLTGDYRYKATFNGIVRDDINGSVEININKGCSEFIIKGY